MAAIATLDQFTLVETPLATNWGVLVGSGLNGDGSVCSPPAYDADHGSYFDAGTGPSTANHRAQVPLTFTTADFSPFALAVRIQDTNNYYYVKFSPGSDENGWSTPDIVQIIKKVSGSDTTITPTNTANGNSLYRAIIDSDGDAIDDAISLRAERIQSGDIFEVQILDNQILVKINHIIVAHETITGIDAAGDIGLINFSGAGDNTYDTFKGGDMTAYYVDGTVGTTGSGTAASPWKTIQEAQTTMQEGSVAFILAATYSGNILTSTMDTRSSFEEPVLLIKKAGEGMTETTGQYSAAANNKGYGYVYGLRFRLSGIDINLNQYDTGPFIFQGCSIVDCFNTGVSWGTANATYNGGHYLLDCSLMGNGRKTGTLKHQLYFICKDCTVRYNTFDGDSFASGPSHGLAIQAFFSSGSTGFLDNAKINYNVIRNHDHYNGVDDLPVMCGILLSAGSGCEIIGNYVESCYNGIIMYRATTGARVQQNVSINNTIYGIQIGSNGAVSGVLVYNNTVYQNGLIGILVTANSTGAKVINNISYQNGGVTYTDAKDFTDNGTSTTTGTAGNWLTSDGDPQFSSAGTGNFQLADAANAGSGADDLYTSDGVAADILGYPIPQGSIAATPAFGAYEIPNPADPPVVTMDPTASFTVNVAATFSISVEGQGNVGNVALINWDGSMTASIATPGSATVRGPA